jgi:hypothetical protein
VGHLAWKDVKSVVTNSVVMSEGHKFYLMSLPALSRRHMCK